jgi:geranylgeranyl diphosphate synthase type 3
MITPNYSELLDQLKAAKAPAWSADNERVLLGPYDYLTTVPGKEIRSAFIDAFNAWLKVPEESLKLIKLIVQQLHTASLLCVYHYAVLGR